MNREELLNKLEEIQTEYKRRMHDAQAKEDYIFASGLCGATARIIKLVKEDWDMTQDEKIEPKFKDGDVLATDDGNIFVFDGTVEDGKYPFAYCGLTRGRFESYDRRLPFTHNNVHPATKEQRDQLEKAMADAGYTFDIEKKELRKIKQKFAEWGEEDENRFNNLIFLVKCSDENEPTKKGFIDFINRLKSTSHQRHWKPSDEQIDVLDEVIRNPYLSTAEYNGLIALREQLKAL